MADIFDTLPAQLSADASTPTPSPAPDIFDRAEAITQQQRALEAHTVRQYYHDPETLGGHWTQGMQESLGPFQTDPKQDRAAWANVGFLALVNGKTRADVAPIYSLERARFAGSNFGDSRLDDRAFYDKVRSQYETEEQKQSLAQEMEGDAVSNAFAHAVDGIEPDYVSPLTAWKAGAQRKPQFDNSPDSYLQDYSSRYLAAYQIGKANRDLFKVARDLLVKETGREGTDARPIQTAGPAIEEAARRINDAAPDQQQAVYDMLSKWAARNYPANPSGALNQIAEGFSQMGKSFGRGADSLSTKSLIGNAWEIDFAQKRKALMNKEPVWIRAGEPQDVVADMMTKSALPAFGMRDGYHEATAAERAAILEQLNKGLGILHVSRRLKEIAKNQVDPIRPVVPWVPPVIERAAYGTAQSVPMVGVSLIPILGEVWVGAAMGNEQYDRLRMQYPNMPPDQAALVAGTSGVVMGTIQHFRAEAVLGKLPVLGGVIQRVLTPTSSFWKRFGVSALGQAAEQGGQQAVQDLTPYLVQEVASALSKDVPGVDWESEFAAYKSSRLESFLSVLPFALLGAGVASVRDSRTMARALEDPRALVALGITKDEAERIAALPIEQKDAAFQVAWRARKPADVAKSAKQTDKTVQTAKEIASSPTSPEIEPFAGRFRISEPDGTKGEQLFDTPDAAAKVLMDREAFDLLGHGESVRDLAAWFEQKDPARKFEVSDSPRTLAEAQQPPEMIAERMRIAGLQAGADPAKTHVLGENIHEMKAGLYSDVSRVFQGATVQSVIHERTHGQFKKELSEGTISMADGERAARAWLGDKAPEQLSEQHVHEAVAEMGEAYFFGNFKRIESLPGSVRGFVVRMAKYFKTVLLKARQLFKLRQEGKLDADWEAFLARAVGLDESAAHNRAVEKAAKDFTSVTPENRPPGDGPSFSIAPATHAEDLAKRIEAVMKSPEARIEIRDKAIRKLRELERAHRTELDAIELAHKADQSANIERESIRQDTENRIADLEKERDAEIAQMGQNNLASFMDRIEAAQTDKAKALLEREAKVRGQEKAKAITQKYAERIKRAAAEGRAKSAAIGTDTRKKQAGEIERTTQLQSLATLDALASVLPPDVRAKMGGSSYTNLAELKTAAARTRFISDRIELLDRALETSLRKDFTAAFDKLLERSQPKGKPGEKAKGKIGVEGHRWFAQVEKISKMTDGEVDDRLAAIEARLSGEITPEDIKELGVTTEDEARDALTQETGLLIAYGNFAEKSAAEMASGVAAAKAIYSGGRLKWIEQQTKLREQRAALRDSVLIPETNGAPATDTEIALKERADAGIKGAINAFLGRHYDLDQSIAEAAGADSMARKWVNELTVPADLRAKDALYMRETALIDFIKGLIPGTRLERMRRLEELQTRDLKTGISPLEAVHYTMLWKQEGLRTALEIHGYGEARQAEFEAAMSPEAKAIRNWLWDQYDAQYGRINPVFQKLYGVDLPRVAFYAPAFFEVHGKESRMAPDNIHPQGPLATLGNLRVRKDHTARPEQVDALQAFIRNGHDVEHWIAWAEPMRELRAVLGHTDVRRAVAAKSGRALVTDIANHLDIIEQQGAKNAEAQGAVAKLARRFTSALADVALVAKLVVLGKQIPAVYASAADIGVGAYLKSSARVMAGQSPVGFFEMLKSDAIQRRMRALPVEMRQLSHGYLAEVKGLEKMIRDVTGGLGDGRSIDLALHWARQRPGIVDAFLTSMSAAAALDHHYTEARSLGMPHEEALAKAWEDTEVTISRTAQPDSLLGKSVVENSLGPMGRGLFQFQSANRKALGLTILATRKKGFIKGALPQVLVHWIVTGLVTQTVANFARWATSDDDLKDDFNAKDYALSMGLGPLTGFVYLGTALEAAAAAISGAHYAPRVASPLADAINEIKSALHKKHFDVKSAGAVATAVGEAMGGRFAAVGVAWNVLKQALGLHDALTPGDQENATRARKSR